MNSKMIAIIAVVAMCGAALVGVGYAYTATITNDGNSVTTDTVYVSFTNSSVAKVNMTASNFQPIYDSVNDGTGSVEYTFSSDNDTTEGNWIADSEGSPTKYTKTVITEVILTVNVAEADESTFSIQATDNHVANNYIKIEYKWKDGETYKDLNTKTFTKADGASNIVTITAYVFVSVEAPATIDNQSVLTAFTNTMVDSFTTTYKVTNA